VITWSDVYEHHHRALTVAGDLSLSKVSLESIRVNTEVVFSLYIVSTI
jgi:hypothetical protein